MEFEKLDIPTASAVEPDRTTDKDARTVIDSTVQSPPRGGQDYCVRLVSGVDELVDSAGRPLFDVNISSGYDNAVHKVAGASTPFVFLAFHSLSGTASYIED